MPKLKLNFMVDPNRLQNDCEVTGAIKIAILDPDHELLKPFLGQSGRKMAKAGFAFYFKKDIAKKLIKHYAAIAL